jgi:hypothetical protein
LQKEQRESLLKKYSSVEQAGVKDREERIQSGLLAAQTKLAQARANDDVVKQKWKLKKKLQDLVMKKQDCKKLSH